MARGTVITLSGGVLFETGKSELLSGAQDRLSRVADYLKNSPRSVVVEGYTDSTGSSSTNHAGSPSVAPIRCETTWSLRAFPPTASPPRGRATSSPVASNANSTGRAMNRRVEIVLQKPPEPAPATSGR